MRKYILFLACVMGLWSCDDFLTVNPKSQISEDKLFSTSGGYEEALYGIYASMGTLNLYGMNLRAGILDVMGQNYQVNSPTGASTWSMMKDFEKKNDDVKKYHNTIWNNMYEVLGYTNNVIKMLEQKDETSVRFYNLYMGEALGLRAFMHFDLVRLFAPHVERKADERGIPYVKKWTVLVTPFSSVKEVYANVVSDLKSSERYLLKGEEEIKTKETEFTKNRNIHFNLLAAQATLARVYWMCGNLDSARIYAEKVIKSTSVSLAKRSEIGEMHAGAVESKETIFGLYTKELMSEYKQKFYIAMIGMEVPLLTPRADYGELYKNEADGNDVRLGWFRVQKETGYVHFMKFCTESQLLANSYLLDGGKVAGISLISLPEMYLIATEALLTKNPSQALIYFDTFIGSRGVTKFSERVGANKKELTLDEIYKERTKELIGDGQEFFAMKKQLRSLPNISLTEDSYIFMIPDTEFEYRPDEKTENN